jgi:leucyl/phenylalanyl-tRNA--protein transferase
MPIFLLSEKLIFPSARLAREDGLLAIGGDLGPERLLLAYRSGIFPWFTAGEPILWWSPDPRLVLQPADLRLSRSLRRTLNRDLYRVTADRAFERVIRECAVVRLEKGEPTWIVEEMVGAYCRLHQDGYGHSIEVWQDRRLVGGLYGVSLGRCFFGESMFSRARDASKVGLVALTRFLAERGFEMIDCQVTTAHLLALGAREVPRDRFLSALQKALAAPTLRGPWWLESGPRTVPGEPSRRQGPLPREARPIPATQRRKTPP